MSTVYISIGNSDDKLTQGEWASFVTGVRALVTVNAPKVWGYWLSPPDAPWQNMCICAEVPEAAAPALKAQLADLRRNYRQESVAWAEAVTEMV